MCFHRATFDEPSRFVDFLTTASFSCHIWGGVGGIGFKNLLMHILLGVELIVRLDKMGSGQKYPNFMAATTSALVVISRLWMQNVSIWKNPTSGKYVLNALNTRTQEDGLVRFAETIGWPYMDEARQNVPNL